MAAPTSTAANGMLPLTGGELTNTSLIGTNSISNDGNPPASGGTSARNNKQAASSRHAPKRLAKESGDQIGVSDQRKKDGSSDSNNNSSNGSDYEDENNADSAPRQRRVLRKGGLSQELRDRIKQNYQARTVNLVVRYNKLGSQFADFANNVAFLSRCANMSMVPKLHRVYNQEVRNTRIVIRILDQCCYKVLMADLDHNRRRKYQVRKNREKVEQRLREIMAPQDFDEVQKICEENKEQHFNEVKEKQRKEFEELMEEYKNNEARRRSDSRRGRRTISADRESEAGAEQSRRDTKSAEPQPALQAAVNGQPPKEQQNEDRESHAKKQETAQKAPKDTKAKTGAVGKDSAKDASSSKKQAPKESAANVAGAAAAPAAAVPSKKSDQKDSK